MYCFTHYATLFVDDSLVLDLGLTVSDNFNFKLRLASAHDTVSRARALEFLERLHFAGLSATLKLLPQSFSLLPRNARQTERKEV